MKNIKKIYSLLMVLSVLSAMVVSVSATDVPSSVTATAGPLATITISPGEVTVLPGGSQIFTATGADADSNIIDPITPVWSVSGGGSIDVGTGLFTASASELPGMITVTATIGEVSGTATVTIPEIKSVSIEETEVNFGEVQIGGSSASQPLTITNTGNVEEAITVTASDLSDGVNTIAGTNIAITGVVTPLSIGGSENVGLVLTIPTGTVLGTYTGTISVTAS